MLILFGNDVQFRPVVQQLLQKIVATTLQTCGMFTHADQLSEMTDVLESFFAMMSQLYKKIPQLVSSSGIDTASLFRLGLHL